MHQFVKNAAIDESLCDNFLDKKIQINNSVLKNRKTTLTAVVFHFVAAVQEQDNFKTLVN